MNVSWVASEVSTALKYDIKEGRVLNLSIEGLRQRVCLNEVAIGSESHRSILGTDMIDELSEVELGALRIARVSKYVQVIDKD